MVAVERIIEDIQDGVAPMSATLLAQLSDLGPEDTQAVVDALRQVSFERRRMLVQRLIDLAEENVDLNFDYIFRRCINDEDGEVRTTAILGLWECEERSLIEPLVRLLKRDPEEQVRAAAAQSLGRFALLSELGKLLERDAKKIEEALLRTIDEDNEPSTEVRRRAVEALGPINSTRVRDIVREAYESANDKMRASALYAMGRNGDPMWIPYILDEMESSASELRYEAAVAAGQLGDESMVPAMAHLVNDPDPEVQTAAVGALGQVGSASAVRVLRRLLHAPDERLQELARDAIEGVEAEEPAGPDLLRRHGPGRAASRNGESDEEAEEEEGEVDEEDEP